MPKRKNSNLKRRSQRGRNSYAKRSSINDLMLEMFKNDLVDEDNDIEIEDTNIYNIVDKNEQKIDNYNVNENSNSENNTDNIVDSKIDDTNVFDSKINNTITESEADDKIIPNSEIFNDISVNSSDNVDNQSNESNIADNNNSIISNVDVNPIDSSYIPSVESSDKDIKLDNTVSASLDESLDEDVEIDNKVSDTIDNSADEDIILENNSSKESDEALSTKEFVENYVRLYNETHPIHGNSSDESKEEVVESKEEEPRVSAEEFLDEYIKSINKNKTNIFDDSISIDDDVVEASEKFLDDNTDKIEAYINSYIQKNMKRNLEEISNEIIANPYSNLGFDNLANSSVSYDKVEEPVIPEVTNIDNNSYSNSNSYLNSINTNGINTNGYNSTNINNNISEDYQKQFIKQLVQTNLKEPETTKVDYKNAVTVDTSEKTNTSSFVDKTNNYMEKDVLEENVSEEPDLYNEYYEDISSENKNENSINTEVEEAVNNTHEDTNYNSSYEEHDTVFEDNNILLISEREGKVFLPYKQDDINLYLRIFPDKYSSAEEVIKNEFILPMSYFEGFFPSLIRFREAYALYRDRGGRSIVESIVLAFKLMDRPELHPAIIAACRNEKVFKNFLNKLDNNDLENFKDFEIYFKINPMVRV